MATVAALTEASACVDCGIPRGAADAVQIYLLQQIAGNTMTPSELMEAAACYDCIPKGMRDAVQIYLLNQIQDGGGGDPEVFALPGSTVPVAAPVGGAGLAYNVAGDGWFYSGGGWVQFISA